MKLIFLLGLSLYLAGCATTTPLAGADIEYRLPRTDAVATVTLTLKDCSNFNVDGSIAVAPQAGASSRAYKIQGESLASTRIKRTFKIAKNGNDVLIAVNSTVADRTTQIIGNVIKAAGIFAPLASKEGLGRPTCNLLTKAMTERSKALTDQLKNVYASAADLKAKGDDLDVISKQLAAVKTALTISFNVTLVIPDTEKDAAVYQSAAVTEPFRAWFDGGYTKEQIAALYGLKWNVVLEPVSFVPIVPSGNQHRPSRTCGFSIPVPYAVRTKISVEGAGEDVADLKKVVTVFVGQWESRDLCIDAGFAETRTNELVFDDFGHQTSANWASESQAEAISGAIAGSASDVSSLINTISPTAIKAQKAEIDELQTQQTYNKMKACETVIKAGGTTCP
jgi:hypothetical protein